MLMLGGALCAVAMGLAGIVRAQSTTLPPAQISNPRASPNPDSDATLEIAPRSGQASSAVSASPAKASGALNNSSQAELAPVPADGPPSSMLARNPDRPLPYVGISVQRIESHSTPGHDIEGLEIVAVDPGSPAEQAGLKGRTGMTGLGATGATAGALMAPLDLAVLPLLNKAGQLGQTGDLIIAIDDRRVTSQLDLATALNNLKPGDTIYLTVVRLDHGGSKTTKIPVRLASPAQPPP